MQISARKPRVSKPEALCDFSQVWFSTAIGVELLVNWTSPARLPMVVMRSVGLKELKNKLSEYLRPPPPVRPSWSPIGTVSLQKLAHLVPREALRYRTHYGRTPAGKAGLCHRF
jgi:hypothetical protein